MSNCKLNVSLLFEHVFLPMQRIANLQKKNSNWSCVMKPLMVTRGDELLRRLHMCVFTPALTCSFNTSSHIVFRTTISTLQTILFSGHLQYFKPYCFQAVHRLPPSYTMAVLHRVSSELALLGDTADRVLRGELSRSSPKATDKARAPPEAREKDLKEAYLAEYG